jgi:hypothetical protein
MVMRATIAQGRFIHLSTTILVRRSATESALPSKAPAKSGRAGHETTAERLYHAFATTISPYYGIIVCLKVYYRILPN